MEKIKIILLYASDLINLIGVLILLFGYLKVLLKYIREEYKDILHTPIRKIQQIRCELGIYLLLTLDFLIASDILATVTGLDQEKLIELSVMIVLRTAIGFFLTKEVDDLDKKHDKVIQASK